MKKFWQEFKAFIAKGNVLDMAIGVIIASAFSAIVTALTKQILMPIINAALVNATGGNKIYTILWASVREYSASDVAQLSDAAKAGLSAYQLGPDGGYYSKLFYIDWSTFIEAIINFLFIALILFLITKFVMYLSNKSKQLKEDLNNKIHKKDDKEVQESTEEKVEPEVSTPTTDEQILLLLTEIRDNLKKEDKSE
jgi:large conductance mechanosensitive channel